MPPIKTLHAEGATEFPTVEFKNIVAVAPTDKLFTLNVLTEVPELATSRISVDPVPVSQAMIDDGVNVVEAEII